MRPLSRDENTALPSSSLRSTRARDAPWKVMAQPGVQSDSAIGAARRDAVFAQISLAEAMQSAPLELPSMSIAEKRFFIRLHTLIQLAHSEMSIITFINLRRALGDTAAELPAYSIGEDNLDSPTSLDPRNGEGRRQFIRFKQHLENEIRYGRKDCELYPELCKILEKAMVMIKYVEKLISSELFLGLGTRNVGALQESIGALRQAVGQYVPISQKRRVGYGDKVKVLK